MSPWGSHGYSYDRSCTEPRVNNLGTEPGIGDYRHGGSYNDEGIRINYDDKRYVLMRFTKTAIVMIAVMEETDKVRKLLIV